MNHSEIEQANNQRERAGCLPYRPTKPGIGFGLAYETDGCAAFGPRNTREERERFKCQSVCTKHASCFLPGGIFGGCVPLIGVPTIISVVETERLVGHRVPIVPRKDNGSAHVGKLRVFQHAVQVPKIIVFPSRTKGVIKVFDSFALFDGDLSGKNWPEIAASVWLIRERSPCGNTKEFGLILESLPEESLPFENGVIGFLLIKSREYHVRNMLGVLEDSDRDMQFSHPTTAGVQPRELCVDYLSGQDAQGSERRKVTQKCFAS